MSALGGIALTYGSGFVTRRRTTRLPAFFALSIVVGPLLLIPIVLGSMVLEGLLRLPLVITLGAVGAALVLRVWRRTRR